MELPFEKTVCRYWKQRLYTLLRTEETQELRLPDTMPDVGRVISAWSQVILRGKEWRGRELVVSGGIMLWVLYAPEDGGQVQKLDAWIPFQTRTDLPEEGTDGVIRLEAFSTEADARAISSRKLMLRGGAALLVQVLEPEELELLLPGEMPEDLELKKEVYPFLLTREAGEKTFLLDEDIPFAAGMEKPERIIYFHLSPEILEQKVLGSKMAFRGLGNLHVLFLDEGGRLASRDFQVPFAQYVDLDGEYEPEAQVSNLLCMTSMELDILPEGLLRLKCGMVSQYMIQSVETVELLEDCYSPCRELEVERQLFSVPAWLEYRQRDIPLSASVSSDGASCVDLLFTPAAPSITGRSGTAEVELGGSFRGVTLDNAGNYGSIHERASDTIRMETECDTVCFVHGQSSPTCRNEGGSWRTDTRLVADLRSICTKPVEAVSGIRAGQINSPDPERPSVIIRSKGSCESLWDLAKRCGSTVGAIRRLNRLEGEPEEDRLLLIPVL